MRRRAWEGSAEESEDRDTEMHSAQRLLCATREPNDALRLTHRPHPRLGLFVACFVPSLRRLVALLLRGPLSFSSRF